MATKTFSNAVFAALGVIVSATTAAAQSPAPPTHLVRITDERTDVKSYQGADQVVMTAERGTVLEVIHTEGDRFQHRGNNWYLVLLPRDAWGTQRSGWVQGNKVEEIAPEPKPAMSTSIEVVSDTTVGASAASALSSIAPVAPPAESPAAAASTSAAYDKPTTDVVLNFEFAKSTLTSEARAKLTEAMLHLKAGASLSIALEGHADAIGSESFNNKLGLERAETVKRELAASHHVPTDQIGVISYGETHPAASNDTEAGRAENRRVVIKLGR